MIILIGMLIVIYVVNKNRIEVIILNNIGEDFKKSIITKDIIIKGDNELGYEDRKYNQSNFDYTSALTFILKGQQSAIDKLIKWKEGI